MRAMTPHAREQLPVRAGAIALATSTHRRPQLAYRPLPQPARPPRLVTALLWLYRLLFVRPVGRRARAERLTALPDRTLRDIGVKRAHVQAAAWGIVRLCDVVPPYPSAGPLYVCGRPGFRPTLVPLSEAA